MGKNGITLDNETIIMNILLQALSDCFLVFVGRVLRDPQISVEVRVHLLRALAFAGLKDDIVLLLHQDRRDHVLMNYACDIDKLTPEEQQAMSLFVRMSLDISFKPLLILLFQLDVQSIREHKCL